MEENLVRKEISQEDIKHFIEGRDPQERIVNITYNYRDDFVTVFYRNEKDQKCKQEYKFYPYVWATRKACLRLCDGNRTELKRLMDKYSIGVRKLSQTNSKGEEVREFDNGYLFMFYAKRPMSNGDFHDFFKKAGNPIYVDKKDKNTVIKRTTEEERQYLAVTPVEQFMIQTGKRFFKGYDDYDEILKLTFDLETTGLDTEKDRIVQIGIRMNRPFPRYPEGFEKIINIEGETEEEKDAWELWGIRQMLRAMAIFQPDVITGHNCENFDWNIIIGACIRLGTSLEELSKEFFNGDFIRKDKRESCLKLGGEQEYFRRTIVPNITVTDSLHAVRRAQATDSNFKRADLKYSTRYLNLVKPNRVYTPGEKIAEIWKDLEEHYAFNDTDGDWYLYDPINGEPPKQAITPDPLKTVEYFQKEIDNELSSEETRFAYNEFIKDSIVADKLEEELENTEGVNYKEDNLEEIFDEEEIRNNITEEEIKEWKKAYSFDMWARDFSGLDKRTAEKRYSDYLESIKEQNNFRKGKVGDNKFVMYIRNYIADGYELKSGKYIIERYLFDDLYECDRVEYSLNGTDFMLTKLIPVTYQKCCTMGTAGQWKMIMLAWSYEQGLAIPMGENTGSFTGGLSRLLRTGFIGQWINENGEEFGEEIDKLDFNSLYPSIILTWGIQNRFDLSGVMLKLLEYVLTTRELHKGFKKAAGKIVDAFEKRINNGEILLNEENIEYNKQKSIYKVEDNRQASVKKLGNSYFGALGCNVGSVYPWKDPRCSEQTTCTGRQCLRLMISHFSEISQHNGLNDESYNYVPIVGDTDGFNFQLPENHRFTKEKPYVSNGLSRLTKEGKEYIGDDGDIAEFNDKYMIDFHYSPDAVQKMGLDRDERCKSTINFTRKNYSDFFPEKPFPEDVKLVGNTVKSKKMATYIETFLDKAVRLLLQGKGQAFLNEYYSYVDKIYNLQIPLRDIASKGKIKKSLEEYIKDVTTNMTAAGRLKSRQAWYELAIKNNLKVNPGETIYYINTGKSKSHADVKKITHYMCDDNDITKEIEREYKKYKKECKENNRFIDDIEKWMKKVYPTAYKEDEIIMNSILLPRDIIDKEEDTYCCDVSEDMEYNVPKYLEQFNKRITPLLVCFNKEIRSQILIDNPDNRPYFTEEQCILVSGQPNKPSDQDTYEQLMTMEDKEIRFWKKYGLTPPFLEECGMGKWEDILADYDKRMEEEERLGISKEKEIFEKIVFEMSVEDIDNFLEEGEVPENILKFADIDTLSTNFLSKKFNVPIGNIDDIIDRHEMLVKYGNSSED